jgi:hypothetical protein
LGIFAREQQGLPLQRQQLHDALQGMDKTEIEHAVGLAENQDLNTRQGHCPVFDQIEQAPRRGHDNIDAAR